MFTRLHVDAGINPGRIAGELNFLRYAELAGRREMCGRVLRDGLSRGLCVGRATTAANE